MKLVRHKRTNIEVKLTYEEWEDYKKSPHLARVYVLVGDASPIPRVSTRKKKEKRPIEPPEAKPAKKVKESGSA